MLYIRESLLDGINNNPKRGLNPTHFVLIIIFCRIVQVQFLIGVHSIPWLEIFIHKNILKSDGHGHIMSSQGSKLVSTEDSPQLEGHDI